MYVCRCDMIYCNIAFLSSREWQIANQIPKVSHFSVVHISSAHKLDNISQVLFLQYQDKYTCIVYRW